MKLLSLLTLFFVMGATSAPCVTLDRQSYCLAWSNSTKVLDSYEYVRSGETVDNWKNLLTIQRYHVNAPFDEMIDAQNTQLRKSGATPHWIKPAHPSHADEAATEVTLTSGADTEYTLFFFFQDPGKPIEGVIFSRHKPLPGGEPPSQTQIGKWIDQMRAMAAP
jgi:hypothetical protein